MNDLRLQDPLFFISDLLGCETSRLRRCARIVMQPVRGVKERRGADSRERPSAPLRNDLEERRREISE